MRTRALTIAEIVPGGWVAVTDDGVRVNVPSSASDAALRVGQRVWASEDLSQVWIGGPVAR